ncbi:MAG: ATP synthase F1 subunit delta [Acidimicrobiia bacterium]
MDDRINGYAKGFLDIARAEGVSDVVESELYSIAETLDNAPELRSALTDPQLPVDKKTAIIDDLLEGKASSLTVGLVRLLVEQGRAAELPSIARALVDTAASSRDHAVAEIRSAVPLDEETVERLAAALGKATGKRLEVKVIVDESVVGGIVARVGDTVIDGSIANQFDSLRHAVQSR